MLERYLMLRLHVNSVINSSSSQRNKGYILTNEEVQIAENMIVILQPFKVMTKMLSHSTITNSRIIPCLIFLKTKLQSDINDGNDLKEMKAFMFICLNYYIVK